MKRLSNNTLGQLPDYIEVPRYERVKLKEGIVHLGIGAFHRAHQAFYTEAVLNQFGGNWGIIGCSLRSAKVRDQLSIQEGLYTLVQRSANEEKMQVIGSLKSVLVAQEDPEDLVRILANPGIKVVSLTITEKGYCHNPATGNLNFQDPDIQHDLGNLDRPKSAIGYLVAALKARKELGIKSFTALSCDNLPHNGEILKRVTSQFAQEVSSDLAIWIAENTTFPCSMVDRIVPATTDEDRKHVEQRLGVRDEGTVLTEPFSQWVVEDKFADGRPEWEKVGVQIVDDVEIFEKIKIRLLNGAHSILAYSGYLAGFDYISEVMAEPAFAKMVTKFHAHEAGETITAPEGFDIETYQEQLRDRFRNKALKHKTWQIAMDGSQKLPQRWLKTLREQLDGPGHIDIICLGVAAWIRYISGTDDKGEAIHVSDPFAERLREACASAGKEPADMVKAVVGIKQIFGSDLIEESRFVEVTTEWLQEFSQKGVLKTVRAHFG